jgi:L-arabinose isomerase
MNDVTESEITHLIQLYRELYTIVPAQNRSGSIQTAAKIELGYMLSSKGAASEH